MYGDGVERSGSSPGHAGWGADDAWCSDSGGATGEQRWEFEHAGSAGSGPSAVYVTAAVGPDSVSRKYISAAIGSDARTGEYISAAIGPDARTGEYISAAVTSNARACEHVAADAAANSRSEPTERCEQRTRYRQRDSRANGYADRHRAASSARGWHDSESTGLLADARHREIGMRATRYVA